MTKEEFNIAVQQFSARLNRYVLKCLKNTDDAKDIVQDSYEKLWENLKNVPFEKSKSWLFTTAHNALINFLKKKKRLEFREELPTKEAENQYHRLEMVEFAQRAIETLPELQQSIILLRDLEGYDYKEIGEILHLSESQVKVYLFRARLKVKNQLKNLNVLHEH